MSKKGKDMGVFNIVDNRTGKKYTAGSTNMDQLKNQYKNKIEHANHHNEELRKDIENGHTFRFEEVSRDCQTEEEIRALRDAEIYRNRNNTYNKDVNIYFDGGNPNAEYPKGKSEVKFNNVEDFPTSHNNIKPKEVKSNKQTKTKKVPKSHRDNPRYYGKNKIPEKPNRNLGSNRRVRHNTPKQNLGPKGGVLHKIIELKKYTDRYDSLISNDFKNKLIRGIERREIVNKTQIKRRIEREVGRDKYISYKESMKNVNELQMKRRTEQEGKKEKKEGIEVTENKNQILNNLQEIDEKISLIGFYNPEIKKHLEYEKKIELKKLQVVDYNKYLEIETSFLKEELYRYVDEFPISEELNKDLKFKINEGKINSKPQIASIAIKARKNERFKKEIEEIDAEISKLKRQINHLEEKLDKLENDKKQLKKEYLVMDEELYKIEYKKIFELEKSSLGQKSRLNRMLKQLERKRKRIIDNNNNNN